LLTFILGNHLMFESKMNKRMILSVQEFFNFH
jgi:hypothetical protein